MDSLMQVEDLNFSYMHSSEGLSHISFTLKQGEIILLTGDSGCGKSTLLKCLNGLIPEIIEGELTGSICLQGKSYQNMPMYEKNYVISSVFQNPRSQFFTGNSTAEMVFAMENYGLDREQMHSTLLSLTEYFKLEPILNRDIHELSSGERQILALASSLTLKQRIVLFDEPSANLDYANTMKLRRMLEKLREQGYTLIVADHRFYYLKDLVDRVFLLESGQMTEYSSEESFCNSRYRTRNFDLFAMQIPFASAGSNRTLVASLENVSYKTVLYDISLDLFKQEVCVIVGRNGEGKTTLSRLLCQAIEPTKGQVVLSGRQTPFYVMQDPDYQLFGTSVFHELKLGGGDDERINATLQYLKLDEYRDKHPFDLSGGQKQRLQIGLAMLCGREIIVLDEPTSGLDLKSMERVAAEITHLKKDAAVVVVSHDYEFIRMVADRVVYLSEHRLRQDFRLNISTVNQLNNIFQQMEAEI